MDKVAFDWKTAVGAVRVSEDIDLGALEAKYEEVERDMIRCFYKTIFQDDGMIRERTPEEVREHDEWARVFYRWDSRLKRRVICYIRRIRDAWLVLLGKEDIYGDYY